MEKPWFKKFMDVVDRKFHLPTRRKITSMITGIYDSKRQALKIKLESADTMSLTLDLWSDRRMRSFLGVTIHLLSSDMSINSYLLDISYFTGKHTGDNIANHCLSVIDEFNIRNKITFVVTDNEANMIKAFKSASELLGDDRDGHRNAAPVTGEAAESDAAPDSPQGVELVGLPGADDAYDFDGEEPLSDDAVLSFVQNLGVIAQQRISCGIHMHQLVVIDGLKGVSFTRSIMSKASKLASLLHTTTCSPLSSTKSSILQYPLQQTHDGTACTSNFHP